MKNLLLSITKLFLNLLNKVTPTMKSFIAKNEGGNDLLKIVDITYQINGRFLIYHLVNEYLDNHYSALKAIHATLMNDEKFRKFGSKKIVITNAIINGSEYGYHCNTLITNTTTFEEFYNSVKDSKLITNYEDNYPIDVIPQFAVKVWNADEISNRHIKFTKSAINKNRKSNKKLRTIYEITKRSFHTSPFSSNLTLNNKLINEYRSSDLIKPINKEELVTMKPSHFATMDIETMEYNGKQIPVAISLYNYGPYTHLFVINKKTSPDKAVEELWYEFFKYIEDNHTFCKTIFVHNLGSFDGYFIYKHLSRYAEPECISTIIDQHNKFITINYKLENLDITWKDSHRIFEVSLDKLCEKFDVSGKINKYKPEYNKFSLFNKPKLLWEFKLYCMQDSKSLYKALKKAQKSYLTDYCVDIVSIVSTSSLSLKIFRTRFQYLDIPILKDSDDKFIRESYFGGATDYYKKYGKNLHYYDVTSLYPYAMKQPMPHEIIGRYENMDNMELKNFFGFCLAEIETPKTLKPLLPYKHLGKTIFPTGKWYGTYFSEELKALSEKGYKIKLIKGIEFSKAYLFNKYVDHFFSQKKITTGSKRFIAKMHLNQLYGIFGRKKELITTVNVYNNDLLTLLATKIVKTIIQIDEDISAVLLQDNIDVELIEKLNITIEKEFTSNYSQVKNNVAIASAVTAYGRIHMMSFKEKFDVLYTDTDSIITSEKLPNYLIGNNLGMMKDELNGCVIQEAYIFDIKKYGYWYLDENNNRIEKSVIAGVPRNSVCFEDIVNLSKGISLIRELPIRFYKSFKDLTIAIKPATVTVKLIHQKSLINNQYIPIHVNQPYFINKDLNRILSFIRKINQFFKLYL